MRGGAENASGNFAVRAVGGNLKRQRPCAPHLVCYLTDSCLRPCIGRYRPILLKFCSPSKCHGRYLAGAAQPICPAHRGSVSPARQTAHKPWRRALGCVGRRRAKFNIHSDHRKRDKRCSLIWPKIWRPHSVRKIPEFRDGAAGATPLTSLRISSAFRHLLCTALFP